MAFALSGNKIAAKQLEKALDILRHRGAKRVSDDSIHDVRRRLRKVRGLLRLLRADLRRKNYKREMSALRDAAPPLSALRDASAMITTLDALQERHEMTRAFIPLRKALLARRRDIRRQLLRSGGLDSPETIVRHALNRSKKWKLRHETWKVLGPGLLKAYSRAQQAMITAKENPAGVNFHEWRKRLKDFRCHLRLLKNVEPNAMKAAEDQAHKLTATLGNDHDLAGLRSLLTSELKNVAPKTANALRSIIDRRRAELQRSAIEIGEALFTESPDEFIDRMGAKRK